MKKPRFSVLAIVALAAMVLMGLTSALSEARVFKGTSKANKVVGTKKADKMRLGAGNDRASGRGGNDRIDGGAGKDRLSGDAGNDRVSGGTGNDRVTGGKGHDRLSGGAGNDVINAADGRRDVRVDGGKGRNKCKIDRADLAVAHGCGALTFKTAGIHGGGTGGGGAGGPGGPGGSGGGLALKSANGLQCASQLPTCTFTMSGAGADALTGTVSGGGGVTGAGGAVSVTQNNADPNAQPQNAAWTATGSYGCTKDGFLRVTIGTEQVDVPVDCTLQS
jgi:Ca2+-binding RTX toxin-like protein